MPSFDGDRDDAVEQQSRTFGHPEQDRARPDPRARLDPVLHRLLDSTARLIRVSGVAVSLIDRDGERYTKAAERGVPCRVGSSFPLDEGATGHAVAMRRPVVLDDYARLPAGHLAATGRAAHRSALAVPVWWRGGVVAVSIAFRAPGAGFSTVEVDRLEAAVQGAAAPIVQGRPEDATLGAVLRRRMDIDAGWAVASVTESGPVRPVDPELADAAADLLLAWNRSRHRVGAAPLRVAVVHHRHGVRLLAHQQRADPPAEGGWWPPVPTVLAGAEVRFDEVPGWGLALRADLPYAASGLVPDPTPLTPREQQVLHLIRLGRTDREIAARLVLSPKTVEKHVGALLRKTGARSRAAAVATALERGWLGPTGAAVGDSPHTEGPAARLH